MSKGVGGTLTSNVHDKRMNMALEKVPSDAFGDTLLSKQKRVNL
jgi:hypothetical protein